MGAQPKSAESSLHKHALEPLKPLKLLTKDFDSNKDDPLFFPAKLDPNFPAKLEPEELKQLPPTVL